MLFKNLFPALSLLLVASTKLVKAAPLQELTGTAADAYQYVECTFTVQEIGDKPYTVVTRSWKPSSYTATRDEANRCWIYRDAQVGAGFTLAETQAVLQAMPGRVEIGLEYAWLIKDVKDCIFAERVGITPPGIQQ